MKRKELILTLILLCLSLAAFAAVRLLYEKGETVIVKDASGAVLLEAPADRDEIYEIEGKVGLFYLQIEGGRWRAVNVGCPNHDCEAVGWVSADAYRPIICLPNGIVVELKR